jgi:hypothetical protein
MPALAYAAPSTQTQASAVGVNADRDQQIQSMINDGLSLDDASFLYGLCH